MDYRRARGTRQREHWVKPQKGRARRRGAPQKEGRFLKVFLVCVMLLDAVLLARRYFPGEVEALRAMLVGEKDFVEVFSGLGRALEEPTPTPAPTPTPTPMPTPTPTPTPPPTPTSTPEPTPEPTPTPTPEPTSYPYDGPEPPYNATMAYDSLHLTETLSAPVSGGYTSGYGWREHPVDGGDNFHHGVDISSPEGTEIHAFADGVVETAATGESYGNYIQIKHSDTVKTLYAHCSKLLKEVGDEVKMGDVIALVGSTGNVTGPHLHFEVKVNGLWHDPTYYLELP